MDLFSILMGISIPITIGFISKIIDKGRECECSCLQGLGAVGNNNKLFGSRSRTFSFKNQF